jgi:predicted MFS family arabinose efflux permease
MIFWAMLAIAVDIGLARLGYGLVLPGIRADIAAPYSTFGGIATLHFAGYLAGSLAAPLIVRRDPDARRTTVAAHAVVGAFLVLSAFSTSIAVLALTRLVVGIACGVGILSVTIGVFERVHPDERGRVSGRMWSGIAVGLILSAAASPWLLSGEGRWRAGTIAAGLIGVVAAAGLAATFGRVRPLPAGAAAPIETHFRLADLLAPRRYLLLALAYFGFGAAYTAYSTFIVVALRSLHLGPTQIALVWMVLGLAALIGALGVGRILAGRGRRTALAFSLGIAAPGSLAAIVPNLAVALASALGVGLSLAATPAIVSALARARSSGATAARAFAAVTVVFGVGQIVGPFAAGIVADRDGPASVPILAATLFALGAALAAADGIASEKNTGRPHSREVGP